MTSWIRRGTAAFILLSLGLLTLREASCHAARTLKPPSRDRGLDGKELSPAARSTNLEAELLAFVKPSGDYTPENILRGPASYS